MQSFKSFLKIQDYFGMVPTLTHHGKMKYQNFIGSWLSLLINCCCLVYVMTFIIELLSHNNPSLNTVTISNSISPNITLSSDDLIIAFGIMDRSYKIINDPSVFTIDPRYQIITSVNGKMNYDKQPMKVINCTEINLKKYQESGFEKEFISNNLKDYFCFNETENGDPIIIGGNYGSEYYGVITLSIAKCNNETSPIPCKSSEEIDSILNLCYFEVFFLDHFVDVYNFSHPIQTYTQSFYYQIDPKLSKFLYSYFNSINLFSDAGLFFSTEVIAKSFKHNSVSNDVFSINDDEPFAKLWVMSSYIEENFYRSYIKLPAICGNVGGLLRGLHLIASILYSFFEIKLYYKSLINSIFDFSNKDKKTLSPLYKKKSIIGTTVILKSTIVVDKKAKIQKIQLHLSPIQHMKLFCWRCCKKKQVIRKEYLSLEKSFNSKIEFSRVVLCQNEIAIIKEKLFGSDFKGIITKFKWNIWGNNNIKELSMPKGDHLDEKTKSKIYYENDSSINQMSTQGRSGLIKTKKSKDPKIDNYLSRSISLFN